jgi:hypothetical protein
MKISRTERRQRKVAKKLLRSTFWLEKYRRVLEWGESLSKKVSPFSLQGLAVRTGLSLVVCLAKAEKLKALAELADHAQSGWAAAGARAEARSLERELDWNFLLLVVFSSLLIWITDPVYSPLK